MSISKIKRDSITADAVNETKIADNAISEEHLDDTVITGNTLLNEVRADDDQVLIYDTSAGVFKKVNASNVGAIIASLTSVSPTSVQEGDGTGNYTFTLTGTSFLSGISANLVNDSGTTVNFDTVTRDSNTQLTCVIAKSSLPGSGEPYDVQILQSGITSTLTDQININQSPAFVTSAGSLGNVADGASGSFDIVAADPESAGNVTFEIQSGTIPPGMSTSTVNENGVSKFRISGDPDAVGSDTTFNFTIRAVDNASNTSSRAFSITVVAPVVQIFNSSGTFSVPSGISSVDVLVVAGGGQGKHFGGGGGAGGLIFMPGYPVTPGGTVTVTVGCGGLGEVAWPSAGPAGNNGQDSVFGTLTAKGGGHGGGYPGDNGSPGGSGGGAPIDGPGGQGSATQPTQPGNSGAYGFGFPGGGATDGNSSEGGGGGGAGAAGNPGNPPGSLPYTSPEPVSSSSGGIGKAYTIADGTSPVYYAGGGGGAVMSIGMSPFQGQGGLGGGGQGGNENPPNAAGRALDGQPGQNNKGGGAGAPGRQGCLAASCFSASGGKGVVIVRWT